MLDRGGSHDRPAPHDWPAEYAELVAADRRAALPPEDLDRLAVAAFVLGHDAEVAAFRERAYAGYLAAGEPVRAARCGFWLGFHLENRGERARAAGWRARLRRLADAEQAPDGPVHGMAVLAEAAGKMLAGDPVGALPMFDSGFAAAERTGDTDLLVLGCLGRGRCLEMTGRRAEAVAALDEAMVHATGGDAAPQVTGLAYCSVIDLCMRVFDLRRAQEWTQALTGWCDEQSGLVPYRGTCLVHRAEILQLRGAWPEAESAAEDACRRLAANGERAVGYAYYRLAELDRVRGRLPAAERGYQQAAASGVEVQPGLARLRAAQGNPAAAAAGLDRALAEDPRNPTRPVLLAARAELAVATGDLDAARTAVDELSAAAGAPYLEALAAHAEGMLRLSCADAHGAIGPLRRAWALWQQLEAPYEAARTRLLIARACGELGDADAARMEAGGARAVLEQLGAVADLGDVTPLAGGHPLSPRELEVLRLLATGATNRAVAQRLVLSEKTVARHISNIFTKLGVGSRAAATAYAYEHDLV